jgi:hypothetical protein
MPQPIQGPTLAEVALNVDRNLKESRAAGKISAKKLAELRKAGNMTGATQKERARQRAIARELTKYRNGAKGAVSTRKANSLFRESDRIGARARKRALATEAAAKKKAAKAKAVKKAAKKKASTAKKATKKAAKKTARPAKKAAKKVATAKKAAPVKKAAKKRR